MRNTLFGFTAALALAFPAAAHAQLKEASSGTEFSAAAKLNGQEFDCVATGLRSKFFIKVYAVAFCLEKGKGAETLKAASGQKGQAFFDSLRDAKVAKAVDMAFLRDVEKEKIIDAFKETLGKAMGTDDEEGRAKFLALVDRDVKKGEHIVLTAKSDGTLDLTIGGKGGTVTDPKVARWIWNAWIGPDSVAPSLKDDLQSKAQ